MLSKRQSYAVRQIALLYRYTTPQRATRTDPETAAEKPGYPTPVDFCLWNDGAFGVAPLGIRRLPTGHRQPYFCTTVTDTSRRKWNLRQWVRAV
jgi:hypothetical protein